LLDLLGRPLHLLSIDSTLIALSVSFSWLTSTACLGARGDLFCSAEAVGDFAKVVEYSHEY
jgi:hypothetical protein